MRFLTKHPLLVFGLGIVAGVYAHKHRKEIIEAVGAGSEKAKEYLGNPSEIIKEFVAMKHH